MNELKNPSANLIYAKYCAALTFIMDCGAINYYIKLFIFTICARNATI